MIGLAMLGSIIFIGYVVLRIRDNQIPLMASGFVVLGASLAAVALWCVLGMWRAASRARGGRAFGPRDHRRPRRDGCDRLLHRRRLSALIWNT